MDDQVIRQRLRQKMEYFARSSVENAQPSDADLRRMIAADPARYGGGKRISFDQVYLGQLDPAAAARRAGQVRARLGQGADWVKLGEPLSVSRAMERATPGDIEREFGDRFAGELAGLAGKPSSEWRGPVASGYGVHLVRLRAVAAPSPGRLSEVRQQVENDWRAATIDAREAAAYQALLDGYTIRIEKP